MAFETFKLNKQEVRGTLGVLVVATLLGAIWGYIKGVSGDEGTTELGLQRAWKTAFLFGCFVALPILVGLVMQTLRAPVVVAWIAIMISAFATMSIGSALIEQREISERFWADIANGAIVGLGMGLILPRLKLSKERQAEDERSN